MAVNVFHHLRYFGKRARLNHIRLNPIQLILLAVLMVVLTAMLIHYYYYSPDMRFCFRAHKLPEFSTAQALEDVLLGEPRPSTDGRSIFFHETSCHERSEPVAHINVVKLTAREACAIESAALHNQKSGIYVLFASPAYMDNSTAQPLLEAILSYNNVHLRNVNLWEYAADTPMEKWLEEGDLFKSSYVLSHISDFLRYLTLWRWGGTYLDMDVVVLRSLEDVPPNYTGAESDAYLAAGVMNFAHTNFGHLIAEQCLEDFKENFDGDAWGNNGPGVITRVMQDVCGTDSVRLMVHRKQCRGFHVFGRDAFYAIPWKEWEWFFEAQYLEQTLERTKNSYVAHVWNKHSKQRRLQVGAKVAYGKMAEEHCPRVYAAAGEYF